MMANFACFTTIENYTSLKLTIFKDQFDTGFTTIENYTSLKLFAMRELTESRFTPLRITHLSNG